MSKRPISPGLEEYELKSSVKKSTKKDKSFFSHSKAKKLPDIVKQNLKNLTDGEFIENKNKPSTSKPIPITPSPKTKSSSNAFFNSLLLSKEKKPKTANNKPDKRLMGLKLEDRMSRSASMLSSPSIMNSKSLTPMKKSFIEIEDDIKMEEPAKDNNVTLNDLFDKMVDTQTFDNKKPPQEVQKASVSPKEEISDKSMHTPSKMSSTIDDLPPIKEVSTSTAVKINPELVTYMTASRANFRHMVDKVKGINASIAEFRRALLVQKDH